MRCNSKHSTILWTKQIYICTHIFITHYCSKAVIQVPRPRRGPRQPLDAVSAIPRNGVFLSFQTRWSVQNDVELRNIVSTRSNLRPPWSLQTLGSRWHWALSKAQNHRWCLCPQQNTKRSKRHYASIGEQLNGVQLPRTRNNSYFIRFIRTSKIIYISLDAQFEEL